jgi:hypothetical protein
MSAVDDLIREFQAAGLILEPRSPNIFVKPISKLTPDLETRLRQHKAEILRQLETDKKPKSATAKEVNKEQGSSLIQTAKQAKNAKEAATDPTVIVRGIIAIERHESGRLTIQDLLPYAPLRLAECPACHRQYYWCIIPKHCPWRDCGGRLQIVEGRQR